MLSMTRAEGEFIFLHLPDGRRVKIVNQGVNRHGECRLGVAAPPDIKIYRGPELVNAEGELHEIRA